jgi:hypothetical protein
MAGGVKRVLKKMETSLDGRRSFCCGLMDKCPQGGLSFLGMFPVRRSIKEEEDGRFSTQSYLHM